MSIGGGQADAWDRRRHRTRSGRDIPEADGPRFMARLFDRGGCGAQSFVVISGLTVFLVISSHHATRRNAVSSKAPCLRRLTPFEPPGVVRMLIVSALLALYGTRARSHTPCASR